MEFSFEFDEKVAVWIRTVFVIKAETKEEAEKQAIEMAKDPTVGFDDYENSMCSYTEVLYDTMRPIKDGTYQELTHNGDIVWKVEAETKTKPD